MNGKTFTITDQNYVEKWIEILNNKYLPIDT